MDIRRLVSDETRLDVLLAFQPVYTRNLDVKAFVPLIEPLEDKSTSFSQQIYAINRLIVESYTSIYQRGEMQSIPCILNISDEILLDEDLPELPLKQYILEVDAGNLDISPQLIERLQALTQKGYQLCLSGYTLELAELGTLLDTVHMVSLDIPRLEIDQLNSAITLLKSHDLELLADNLSDQAQFRYCLDTGFHYFRGHLFGEPAQVKGKVPGTRRLLLLKLMAKLADPGTGLDELEQLIISDANLTYRLLKAANSASHNLNREIEVLSHALGMLGTEQIRRWLSLFLLEGHDDKPPELMRTMLIRGHMCEILAAYLHHPNPTSFFLVGLLSQLDRLTDIPIPELIQPVPLSSDMKSALLDRSGVMGAVLKEVEDYEKGHFQHLYSLQDRSFYEIAYRHSTTWANQVLASSTPH